VLESRHVIGLFMAVIVLSGLFFTLGYVMGRNQAEGPVRADFREKPELPVAAKPDAVSKRAGKNASAETPTDSAAPASSGWDIYHPGDSKKPDDQLRPAPPASVAAQKPQPVPVKTVAPQTSAAGSKASSKSLIPGDVYILQVAALTKERDAIDLAMQLQKRKFPAFVLSPHADKYYRVQVGPYVDQKAADAARKGLEGAGFKAFIKH